MEAVGKPAGGIACDFNKSFIIKPIAGTEIVHKIREALDAKKTGEKTMIRTEKASL